nr:protein SIEVE ELEMENT OCCLUSION B-like [Ipomoea batatas]
MVEFKPKRCTHHHLIIPEAASKLLVGRKAVLPSTPLPQHTVSSSLEVRLYPSRDPLRKVGWPPSSDSGPHGDLLNRPRGVSSSFRTVAKLADKLLEVTTNMIAFKPVPPREEKILVKYKHGFEFLRRKYVFLFGYQNWKSLISHHFAPRICMFDARSKNPSRLRESFEIVWLPIVDRDDHHGLEAKEEQFKVVKIACLVFSVHPSKIDEAVYGYVKEVLRDFTKRQWYVAQTSTDPSRNANVGDERERKDQKDCATSTGGGVDSNSFQDPTMIWFFWERLEEHVSRDPHSAASESDFSATTAGNRGWACLAEGFGEMTKGKAGMWSNSVAVHKHHCNPAWLSKESTPMRSISTTSIVSQSTDLRDFISGSVVITTIADLYQQTKENVDVPTELETLIGKAMVFKDESGADEVDSPNKIVLPRKPEGN